LQNGAGGAYNFFRDIFVICAQIYKIIKEEASMQDVLIIGHGPAGLSAAIYVSRAGLSVSVVGRDIGALSRAETIENYFGILKPLAGPELPEIGKKQAAALGAVLVSDEIIDLTWNDGFIATGRKGEYRAKAVILATGAARKTAPIKGLDEFEGRGVSYCAVCDAFFYRGLHVAVLGSGEYALHESKELAAIAKSVTILTNGVSVGTQFPDEMTVIETPIKQITGQERVDGVLFTNKRKILVDGVFVALGNAGAVELARKLGAKVDGARVVVDEEMVTTIPGIYAAGDCIGGLLQVATAVAEGATAAMSAIRFVRTANM
jgi:thioredoxin reductase (NADPH)